MNILPHDKQIQAISALCEGVSIRATERLTGIHRDTIMRLGVRVGSGCAVLHDRLMRGLHVGRIEMDEIWSFIGKKQKQVTPDDGPHKGDCYVFLGMEGTSKGIVSYLVGKRDGANTHRFVRDLRQRIVNRPEISSDAFTPYPQAVEAYFGIEVDYGTIDKKYSVSTAHETARRYSPGVVVAVKKRRVIGLPKHVSTSYIERQNLTLRMQQRRFTRLTNGFSKKIENHKAAVALYVAHYNFCRVHEALRVTPAMHLGVADHVWTVGELIEAALADSAPEPEGRQVGPFRVIDGGRA